MKKIFLILLSFTFAYATPSVDTNNSVSEYWSKNLNSYFRVPKNWFTEKRLENKSLSYYITQDKFDKDEQFKVGFSLHYTPNCKEANHKIPSLYAKNIIVNLTNNMGKVVINKPYKFNEQNMVGYGATVKDDEKTVRYILIGDDENNVCLNLLFEAPNDKWKNVERVGNAIMESHWKK